MFLNGHVGVRSNGKETIYRVPTTHLSYTLICQGLFVKGGRVFVCLRGDTRAQATFTHTMEVIGQGRAQTRFFGQGTVFKTNVVGQGRLVFAIEGVTCRDTLKGIYNDFSAIHRATTSAIIRGGPIRGGFCVVLFVFVGLGNFGGIMGATICTRTYVTKFTYIVGFFYMFALS